MGRGKNTNTNINTKHSRVEMNPEIKDYDGKKGFSFALHENDIGPQELSRLIEENPARAKSKLAEMATGKNKGIAFRLVRRSIVLDSVQTTCNGCDIKVPIKGNSFDSWTRDADKDKDFCPQCSEKLLS